MDNGLQKMVEPLRLWAPRLNAISEPTPFASVFYELMSGSLIWSDEKIVNLPAEVIWGLRPLFAYRSSRIVGSPEEKWRCYWGTCLSLFPDWIGFRPERIKASPQLLEILRKGKSRMMRDLKSLEE